MTTFTISKTEIMTILRWYQLSTKDREVLSDDVLAAKLIELTKKIPEIDYDTQKEITLTPSMEF